MAGTYLLWSEPDLEFARNPQPPPAVPDAVHFWIAGGDAVCGSAHADGVRHRGCDVIGGVTVAPGIGLHEGRLVRDAGEDAFHPLARRPPSRCPPTDE
ncbi:hypothetical protein GCM10010207_20040 [Streptomyces atratus]|nr:hypothetical protein GCM10010207_20040 [Streptomyces atratus]